MQHYSTQRQEAVSNAPVLLTVVKEQEPTPAAESIHLQVVANNTHYTTTYNSYRQRRRYTIDDNGGSYEGL